MKIGRKKVSSADQTKGAGQPVAEAALDKIGYATQEAVAATQEALTATQEVLTNVAATVGPKLVEAVDRIGPLVDDARERIVPLVGDARDRIGPLVDDAKERIGPAVEDMRDKLTPVAEAALAAGKARGQHAAVRMGLIEEPKKSHKLRNLLVLLGLGGVAAFVYLKITGKDADPAWTQTRNSAAQSPTPSVTDPGTRTNQPDTTATVDESDTAPTAPFASEETVESHTPTTPDEPLEKREL